MAFVFPAGSLLPLRYGRLLPGLRSISRTVALAVFVALAAPIAGKAAEPAATERLWSVNAGPNAKNWGYLGVSRDYPVTRHLSLFLTGGLGTILFGGGAAYYSASFQENSFIVSATAGVAGAHADLCHRWKVGKRDFITAGISYGVFFMQYEGFLPVLSYERRF